MLDGHNTLMDEAVKPIAQARAPAGLGAELTAYCKEGLSWLTLAPKHRQQPVCPNPALVTHQVHQCTLVDAFTSAHYLL